MSSKIAPAASARLPKERRCTSSSRAVDVITVVEAAFVRYGKPKHLRGDNGPGFIAYAIRDWLAASEIKTLYITPGSPWENGHLESFHDKLRGECLNRELFGSLLEAQIILEAWRTEYNAERPHSALRYQTPSGYARRATAAVDAKEDSLNRGTYLRLLAKTDRS